MKLWLVIIFLLICLVLTIYTIKVKSYVGSSYQGPFEPLSEEELRLKEALYDHVVMLADTIGERNVFEYEGLEASAQYITEQFEAMGYEPKFQIYDVKDKPCRNIEVEIPGVTHPEEIVVIGAHYDSVLGGPGANDNGTGTAAVLELARMFKDTRPARTLRFVAFVNEEPPFFYTRKMGSQQYASRSKQEKEDIVAMISVETIGYFDHTKGSQKFPTPVLKLFYPDTANFIGFVSNLSSSRLLFRSLKTFRENTNFPSYGATLPPIIPGVSWSDHNSFWKKGYPAIMITDTALFRYPFYHLVSDTYDKIDYEGFARVTMGIRHVVETLVE